MKSPFASLAVLYAKSMFGFGMPSRAELREPRKLLKAVGIVIFALFLVADIGFLFVMTNVSLYSALKPIGLQDMLLLNAATSTSVLVFLFGFITALSMWSMSAMEANFLSMPFKPSQLLGAKMAMIYLTNLLFSVFLLTVAMVVYGIKERPPFMFYVNGLLSAFALPLIPLALSYLLLVPLMSAAKRFRNKNFLLYAGGVAGLVAALGFNAYLQATMVRLNDPEWLTTNLAGPESLMSRIGSAWPPAWLAWKALSSASGVAGFGAALANLALGSGAVICVALTLGGAYTRSVVSFGESTLVRRRATAAFMGKTFARRPVPVALFLREFRLMNREPMYLLNGPFVPVLMPLFMALMYFIQKDAFAELTAGLEPILQGPAAYLIPSAFGAFLGASTSIACTAVSRDAKALPWLRSLPVDPLVYLAGKFLHAEAFALFGALIGALSGGILFGLSAADCALAFLLAVLAASVMNLIGLWLDTAWPRLRWDNPIAPLKQNPNAVISILGAMALIGGSGWLSSKLQLPKYGYALFFGGIFALFLAAGALIFPRFARARMERWEA